MLPSEDLWGAIVELEVYFRRNLLCLVDLSDSLMIVLESFGNSTRIDYGTGHEFKFCAFLCCLMKLGVVPQEAAAPLALKVFSR